MFFSTTGSRRASVVKLGVGKLPDPFLAYSWSVVLVKLLFVVQLHTNATLIDLGNLLLAIQNVSLEAR